MTGAGRHSAPRARRRGPRVVVHAAAPSAVADAPSIALDDDGGEVGAAPRPSRVRDRSVPPRRPRRVRSVGRAPSRPAPVVATMVGSALVVLAVLLLGLVANILFVSQVLQARDQSVLYADLRLDLANATVPVGQLDSDGVLVEAGRPVAMLRIPSLGVEQVVVEGTTSGVLMTGPGHRRDTVMPGQAGVSVVFGRQAAYGGPFAAIGSLRTDDVVEVTTGQGEMTFRVTGVRRAGDPLPTALAAGESRLVLVSAEGQRFAPDGVVRVDTVLVGDPQPAGTRVITSPTQAETPMAGDPTSWLGVLLWSQLLLLVAVAATWSWIRWGRWQTWVIGLPVLAFVGLGLAGQLTGLLPNLI